MAKGWNFFPVKEYSFVVEMPKVDAMSLIAANVMRPQASVDLISEFADHQLGSYRYFEGMITGDDFTANCKQYPLGRSPLNRMGVIPTINGRVNEKTGKTEITIVITGPPKAWWMIQLLAVVLMLAFFPGMMVLLFLPVVFLILLLLRASYLSQVLKDTEQLKRIFEKERTGTTIGK